MTSSPVRGPAFGGKPEMVVERPEACRWERGGLTTPEGATLAAAGRPKMGSHKRAKGSVSLTIVARLFLQLSSSD